VPYGVRQSISGAVFYACNLDQESSHQRHRDAKTPVISTLDNVSTSARIRVRVDMRHSRQSAMC